MYGDKGMEKGLDVLPMEYCIERNKMLIQMKIVNRLWKKKNK